MHHSEKRRREDDGAQYPARGAKTSEEHSPEYKLLNQGTNKTHKKPYGKIGFSHKLGLDIQGRIIGDKKIECIHRDYDRIAANMID